MVPMLQSSRRRASELDIKPGLMEAGGVGREGGIRTGEAWVKTRIARWTFWFEKPGCNVLREVVDLDELMEGQCVSSTLVSQYSLPKWGLWLRHL